MLGSRGISERKRLEQSLRLTRFSVDHAAELVYWVDSQGRLVDASATTARSLGYSRDELLGMTIFDFTVGATRETWPHLWESVKRGFHTVERELRTKDGSTFYAEISANYLALEDRELECIFARDITKRVEAERALRERDDQLRQSQKMEAIGQLAGGIAHDFNNLLTAIIGYSDLVLGSKEGLTCNLRVDVEEIRRAADRASALTRQILAFSRRQTLQPDVVSVNDIVTDIERLLSRTLGEDIDLVSRLCPDLGLVELDVSQFEQVIMNLALNSRDALPDGGTLTIETANVELGEEFCRAHTWMTPGPYIRMAVSDTGVGMDEETRSRVFEPFFTTKGPGRGTGLGLSTVYGTVKQSGGSILVSSVPGKGTTVEVYLPRADQPKSKRPATISAAGPVTGDETILVVEDETAVRGLVARLLTHLGYQVISAENGDQALALLQDRGSPIEMLLTDLVLPGTMQGHELASAAQLACPGLPVLYMSGYAFNGVMHVGPRERKANYLGKPFAPADLARQVREVLECQEDAE